MKHDEVLLLYDHQCPVCNAYCQRVRIRASESQLKLLDARVGSPLLEEVTRRGLDIDQGMVLKAGDKLYYGAEAIHQLSLRGERADPFNALAYWTFRWRWAAHHLYPILRFFRNLLLKLLGRTKINNLSVPHNERF